MNAVGLDLESVARKFRQAGLVYLIAGAAVVGLTLLSSLVVMRLAGMFLLVFGLMFVALFGLFIWLIPLLWRWRWTRAPSRWLVRFLALTNALRVLLFVLNAVGLNVHVFRGTGPAFFIVHTQPNPIFFVNALLMALITFMLARAGWARLRFGD